MLILFYLKYNKDNRIYYIIEVRTFLDIWRISVEKFADYCGISEDLNENFVDKNPVF